MAQKFYNKASVQVAIITGIVALLVTGITILHQRSELVEENKRLNSLTEKQTDEIQRLETLLTPFRTIALEKFTGPEVEALQKLAERVTTIDAALVEAKDELEKTKQELLKKTSDRSLTEDQKENLKTLLSDVSGKVIVKGNLLNSESQMFAKQVKSVLSETGLTVIEQDATGLIAIHQKGIFVIVHDMNNPPSHALPILKAFTKVGIDIKASTSEDAKFPKDTLIVWICRK